MKQWKAWLPFLVVVGVVAIVSVLVAGRALADDGDGWLGVYIQSVDEDLADAEDLESTDGVLITRVIKNSPAREAGLERGDIIIEYDGKNARSVRRLTRMIDLTDPGENVEIVIWRDGREKTLVVEIGEDDEDVIISDFGDLYIDMPKIDMPRIKIPRIDIDVPRAHRAPRAPRAPHAYSFSTGHLSTAHIGVSLYDLTEQLADAYGVKGGALVTEVHEDTPAEKAGLKAGDVIVRMDDRRVDDISEIREAIQDKEEDETIDVTVLRDGSEKTFDVGIEESNTWSGVGVPGVRAFSWTTREHDDDWDDEDWDDEDWGDEWREAMRDHRGSYKEWGDEWRGEWREALREAMKELREELKDLREELEDLDDDG